MSSEPSQQTRQVELRFYEELNDFLAEHQRRKSFLFEFSGTPSVGKLIVSIGIPAGAIDLVLVNDMPVEFSYPLQGGERIAVFPVFERFDISPITRLRARPLRVTRFVVEWQLEKLARLLRLAGFDSVCRKDLDDLDIIELSSTEKRIILSRDPALLKNANVTHGYCVQVNDAPAQFREIIETFDLRHSMQPMSRCIECNGPLRVADESDVIDKIPFSVLVAFDDFWQCEQCHHVYWKGPHYMQLDTLLS